MSGPGRPRVIDREEITEKLLLYKSEIILLGDKVLSKNDHLWEKISEELGGKKTAKSLHSYVSCNKDGIRDLMNGREKSEKVPRFRESDQPNSSACDATFEENLYDAEDIIETKNCTISMKMSNFKALAQTKNHKNRSVVKLKPGVWQQEISERIWNATKLKCGFNFKNHYLSADLSTGSAKGMYLFALYQFYL
uniref:Uncharacterized protein LOC114334561 n=1 Tax=Diabrotica virgifera virgifera TaxID=50390 RepID=A0A6P7G042_DIAVI